LARADISIAAENLTLYEYDGGIDKHPPDLVAFPEARMKSPRS